MTAFWFMIPAKVKLYGLIILGVLLAFVGYKNKVISETVTRTLLEVSNADDKRAANIRAAVRDRVQSDTDGYRD